MEHTLAGGVDITTHGGAMTLNARKTEDGVELSLTSGAGTPLAYIPLDPESARQLARTLLEFDA